MKKTLATIIFLIVIATVIAIPLIIVTTTKTVGSISYADAQEIVTSGVMSGKSENEVIQKLGNPDFRLDRDADVVLQYEIEREVHAFKIDYLPDQLCVIIDRADDQVIDVYVSD